MKIKHYCTDCGLEYHEKTNTKLSEVFMSVMEEHYVYGRCDACKIVFDIPLAEVDPKDLLGIPA